MSAPDQYREVASALPAAYEPKWLGDVACLRSIARQRAADGAPEGTLLIADNLQQAVGRVGKHWQGYAENLHAAVILQPEISQCRFQELLVVGLVSLGQAISAHVSPMTALTYSWPNDINIATNKIASMWIDHGVSSVDQTPWLALTASVNIVKGPSDFSLPAMSLHEAEGNKEINRDTILLSWTRQFVTHLNDWDERGFSHPLSFWKARLDLHNHSLTIQDTQHLILEVDEQGSAVIQTSKSECRTLLPLMQWMTDSVS